MKSKLKKNKIEDTKKSLTSEIKSFIHNYLGVVIAIIFVIILIITTSFMVLEAMQTDNETVYYSKIIHEENQGLISDLINETNTTIDSNEVKTTLDKLYLKSLLKDLNWISDKENQIYKSYPKNQILIKEMSVYYFVESLIEVQQIASIEIGGPNYNIISQARSKKSKTNYLDEDGYFEDPTEDKLFIESYNLISKEYFNWKKELLDNDTYSNDEKYVEAKKILLISEDE
ncbi:MAG: hypothetical protein PHQ98_04090 [Candidatus ainarchaeum sp.]|nr:hypothetical protein [Candidatus ainarchaeum sp.]